MNELREIGDEAAWSLSSAKPGNGVEQLRDGNTETFWQSDGPQPHLINIQFQRKVKVTELRIFTSYKIDESYTPSCLSVRIGTAHHDLQEIQVVDLKEPDGWVTISLARPRGEPVQTAPHPSCVPRDPEIGGAVDFVRTHFIQLAVLSNHQNGRDTHMRQIQVHGPRGGPSLRGLEGRALHPQTAALRQFAVVR
uniref:Anaphase-promoting complex subunit 10 n=1 Tax=Alexandrium andersonii TaxID=327968 RepID=A0A7S2GHP1_9DINO|mmetsp:Transcript_52295/g.118092  ORF Transcript_52295/g.118092 Transcript_52295/m.118092 type:complete len:194 (+) Transcript_52295:66-647(+)